MWRRHDLGQENYSSRPRPPINKVEAYIVTAIDFIERAARRRPKEVSRRLLVVILAKLR
jgi:hypothetical protein